MGASLDEFVETYVEVESQEAGQAFGDSDSVSSEIVEDAFIESLRSNMEYDGSVEHVSLDSKQNGDFNFYMRESHEDLPVLVQTLSDLNTSAVETTVQPQIVMANGITIHPDSEYANSFERLEGIEENNTSDNLWPVRDLEGNSVYTAEDLIDATNLYLDNPEHVDSLAIADSGGERVAQIHTQNTDPETRYELEISVESSRDEIYGIAEVVSSHLE